MSRTNHLYVALSILILVDSRGIVPELHSSFVRPNNEPIGAIFYNINVQTAYLCIAVGMNIVYTILVGGRILATRNQVRKFVGKEHAESLTSVFAMIVESAAMYSVLGVLYIASFASHSNLSNLIFLDIRSAPSSSCSPLFDDLLYNSTAVMFKYVQND